MQPCHSQWWKTALLILNLKVQLVLHSTMDIDDVGRHVGVYCRSSLITHHPVWFIHYKHTIQKVFKVDSFILSHQDIQMQVGRWHHRHSLTLINWIVLGLVSYYMILIVFTLLTISFSIIILIGACIPCTWRAIFSLSSHCDSCHYFMHVFWYKHIDISRINVFYLSQTLF